MTHQRLKTSLFLLTLSLTGPAFSLISPVYTQQSTFLGPSVQLSRHDTIDENLGFSVLGELGLKNTRFGGTLAWQSADHQRVKLSAEGLFQDITYTYFSGRTDQWVSQGALALGYQTDLGSDPRWLPQLNLGGFISHALTKTIGNRLGQYLNASDVALYNFNNARRIAGSNAAGLNPGVTIQPWRDASFSLDLNYDNVRYDTVYGNNHDAKGLGATATFSQAFSYHTDMNLIAAVRAPFNWYGGDIGIVTPMSQGAWRFGVGGNAVIGKQTLPDTYSLMLTASYLPYQPSERTTVNQHLADEFIHWIEKPAGYLPQVLAIADQHVTAAIDEP